MVLLKDSQNSNKESAIKGTAAAFSFIISDENEGISNITYHHTLQVKIKNPLKEILFEPWAFGEDGAPPKRCMASLYEKGNNDKHYTDSNLYSIAWNFGVPKSIHSKTLQMQFIRENAYQWKRNVEVFVVYPRCILDGLKHASFSVVYKSVPQNKVEKITVTELRGDKEKYCDVLIQNPNNIQEYCCNEMRIHSDAVYIITINHKNKNANTLPLISW